MPDTGPELILPEIRRINERYSRNLSSQPSWSRALSRFAPTPLRFDVAQCAIDAASSDRQTSELGAVGFLVYSKARPFAKYQIRRVAVDSAISNNDSSAEHYICWPGFGKIGPMGAAVVGELAFSSKRDAIATPSHIYFLANPKIFINRKLGFSCRQEQRALSPRTTMSLLFMRLLQVWRSKRTKSLLLMMIRKTARGLK